MASVAHAMEDCPQTARAIGILNEKPLHAALKGWAARPGDILEADVEGFVVDIVRGDQLIEVQTGSFAKVARKLASLTERHRVRLVHPIAQEKWIIKLDEHGEKIRPRRKSPRRGAYEDVFRELVYIPDLVANPAFAVEVVLTREDEYRRFDRSASWRRRGWVVEERRLIEVVGCRTISTPAHAAQFLPAGLPVPFSTDDLAQAIGKPRRLAQRMAYCLRKLGSITPVGRRGNSILYVRG